MNIASYIGTSFIDYPGNISLVVFTRGCNMNCEYCHNKSLETTFDLVDEKKIFDLLLRRKGLIDAVVISGGEPTLQSDLYGFCFALKEMGYKVKLDTNGTNPKVLLDLIENKLIDYIAMDIKTSKNKYKILTGIEFKRIKKSIEIVKMLENHEFRTTLYPEVNEDDIKEILELVGNSDYYLQQYRKVDNYSVSPYSDEYILKISEKFNINVRNVG